MRPPRTVYIAGPMRDREEYNFPAFHAAAKDLRSRGFCVLSPAEHDEENGFNSKTSPIEALDLEDSMRWDIKAVLQAEAVVVLPGWRSSRGCAVEVAVAEAVGTEVLAYPDLKRVPPETVTEEAQRLVYGARQASYGHPFDDFSRTGRIWGAILGVGDIAPHIVGLCMAAVKISREVNGHKRDNLVDLAGYAATVELALERQAAIREGFVV